MPRTVIEGFFFKVSGADKEVVQSDLNNVVSPCGTSAIRSPYIVFLEGLVGVAGPRALLAIAPQTRAMAAVLQAPLWCLCKHRSVHTQTLHSAGCNPRLSSSFGNAKSLRVLSFE